MHLYVGQGRRAAALRQYQECRAALKRELNAEPGLQTEQLHREILENELISPPNTVSVQVEPAAQTVPAAAVVKPGTRRWAVMGAGVLLLVAAGTVAIWQFYPVPTSPVFSPLEPGPLLLPDRPSIAVLAFDNLSGDPGQSYLGDAIADDIITALSHLRGMLVIARTSSFSYKDKPVDVRKIGEELGVRHVLEGSVHRMGDQLRITAQLVDAKTREHIWAERYDRPADNLFTLHDDIVETIVTALDVTLVDGEQVRTWRRSTTNPKAYELFMRAREFHLLLTREAVHQSIALTEQALDLDPNFARALVLQGWNHDALAWSGWSESASDSWEQAIAYGKRALAIDASLDYPHTLLGSVYITFTRRASASWKPPRP